MTKTDHSVYFRYLEACLPL